MPSPLILSVLRELSKTTPTQPSDSCNDYEKNPLVEVYVNKHYMGITQLDTAQTLYRTAINPNYLFENDDHTAFSRNSKGLVQYTLVDLESLREAVQLNESYEDYEDLDEDYEDLDEDYEDLDEDYEDLTEEQLAEIAETITEEEFEQLDEISKKTMLSYYEKAKSRLPHLKKKADSAAVTHRYEKDELDYMKSHKRGAKDIAAAAKFERETRKEKNKARHRVEKRQEGIKRAVDRLTKEEFEHLDELSNAKMRKYKRSAWLSGKIFGTAAKELRDVAKYTARETGQEARRNGRSPEKLQQDAELIQGIKASSRTMQAKADKRKEGRERASRLMKRK